MGLGVACVRRPVLVSVFGQAGSVDAMTTRWEYGVQVVKNPEIHGLEKDLAKFGKGGWELVTMTSTVKFWNRAMGNDLVLVFKRQTDEPADMSIKVTTGVEIDPGTGMPIDQVVQ